MILDLIIGCAIMAGTQKIVKNTILKNSDEETKKRYDEQCKSVGSQIGRSIMNGHIKLF